MEIFKCECCSYETKRIYDFNKHLKTKKHKKKRRETRFVNDKKRQNSSQIRTNPHKTGKKSSQIRTNPHKFREKAHL